ncbi:unnamed protein product [Caenorhabditis angaria]|uniref:Membrane protein BRI3 n=1 Tax=Caenorhabditis angaria TaxID=860376 RepID=A0A9P1ICX6_9PELO|nr:unnamed protein product [Caenorhabditis angaria]
MSNTNEKKQPLPDVENPPTEGSSSSTLPSAPQIVDEIHSTSPPRPPPPTVGFVYPQYTEQSTPVTPVAPQPAYSVPPPSYQAAMSYPAAPTYGGNASQEPKYYSGQPPTYYQPPPQPIITQTRLPQPVDTVQTVRVATNSVVVVQRGPQCRVCNIGVITRRNDMCCLLCLIILTIFTFPFGLVFLCCVPCTVQNRCSNCNHIA